MDIDVKAVQAAMAAEIRSKVGRMNRSQAWLQRETDISASAWRHYFTKLDREVPMAAVLTIASKLQMPAAELVSMAQAEAHHHIADIAGLSEAERADLERTLRPDRQDPQRNAGLDETGS